MGMILSMLAYIVLGLVISRQVKSVNDFFVAGRKAPTFLIVGSLVASYCSTGLFMGDVGEAYSGFYAPRMMMALMLTAGYVIGGVFFGKYLRRSEALTIPEFFGERFHSRSAFCNAGNWNSYELCDRGKLQYLYFTCTDNICNTYRYIWFQGCFDYGYFNVRYFYRRFSYGNLNYCTKAWWMGYGSCKRDEYWSSYFILVRRFESFVSYRCWKYDMGGNDWYNMGCGMCCWSMAVQPVFNGKKRTCSCEICGMGCIWRCFSGVLLTFGRSIVECLSGSDSKRIIINDLGRNEPASKSARCDCFDWSSRGRNFVCYNIFVFNWIICSKWYSGGWWL